MPPTVKAVAAILVFASAGCATAPLSRSQNRVLEDDRAAAAALRAGDDDGARAKLDDAIPLVGGILTNSPDAARARSLFHPESSKIFIGEPYERAMTFYYRAILYWRDGQPDNARACYRTGELIDSDLENHQWTNTFALLDFLDGFASVKLGADGQEAYVRARAEAGGRALPVVDSAANVLIFAEFGLGPRKYAAGQYGERLKFLVRDSPAQAARLLIGGRTIDLPAYDDLNVQAATRGGRVMDYILGNKAVFKRTTDAVGDVALAASGVAAGDIYQDNGKRSAGAEDTAFALAAVGLISKITSSATRPRADTRTWDNLPQRLSFAAIALPAGNYPATLEFLDASGQVLSGEVRPVTVQVNDPARATVVFLSELKG